MNNWKHKHIIDLSNFSKEDYETVIDLTNRFKSLPLSGKRKIPALQGFLIANLFFEPSTRTRSSFEIAAKRLSADVQNFNPSVSSLKKGETTFDTANAYVAMGADILVVRHKSTYLSSALADYFDQKNSNVAILNAGDGMHSHPSQALLDLFTLSSFFNEEKPSINNLFGKKVLIVGDILHSRVARSNIWALTACGADVILCGPTTFLPEEFKEFFNASIHSRKNDPIESRGAIIIERDLKKALLQSDAVISLRVQKERMDQNLLNNLDQYHSEFGINHEKLNNINKQIPIMHPGPVNRGIELSSQLVDDKNYSLIHEQVENGIPTRMALLYLLGNSKF